MNKVESTSQPQQQSEQSEVTNQRYPDSGSEPDYEDDIIFCCLFIPIMYMGILILLIVPEIIVIPFILAYLRYPLRMYIILPLCLLMIIFCIIFFILVLHNSCFSDRARQRRAARAVNN
jgi:hypothetical protein